MVPRDGLGTVTVLLLYNPMHKLWHSDMLLSEPAINYSANWGIVVYKSVLNYVYELTFSPFIHHQMSPLLFFWSLTCYQNTQEFQFWGCWPHCPAIRMWFLSNCSNFYINLGGQNILLQPNSTHPITRHGDEFIFCTSPASGHNGLPSRYNWEISLQIIHMRLFKNPGHLAFYSRSNIAFWLQMY